MASAIAALMPSTARAPSSADNASRAPVVPTKPAAACDSTSITAR
jgi:hypothetical protein